MPNWRRGSGPLAEAEPVARVVAEQRLDAVGALGLFLDEFDASFGQRRVVVRPFPAWNLANLALCTAGGAAVAVWRFRWHS